MKWIPSKIMVFSVHDRCINSLLTSRESLILKINCTLDVIEKTSSSLFNGWIWSNYSDFLQDLGPQKEIPLFQQGFPKSKPPGTPSVPVFQATLPLKPATIALKIGHLAFQVVFQPSSFVFISGFIVIHKHGHKSAKDRVVGALPNGLFFNGL